MDVSGGGGSIESATWFPHPGDIEWDEFPAGEEYRKDGNPSPNFLERLGKHRAGRQRSTSTPPTVGFDHDIGLPSFLFPRTPRATDGGFTAAPSGSSHGTCEPGIPKAARTQPKKSPASVWNGWRRK